MYVIHERLCRDEANVVLDSDSELWHKILGHMTQRGMYILAEKDLLPEVKGIHIEKCVECLAGKQKRVAFHSRPPMRRERALELVYTDMCYVNAPSHHGGQYFDVFVFAQCWSFQ